MRFFLVFVGFCAALFLWPWITLVCMVILSSRYYAWEVVLMGLLVDLMWLPAGGGIHIPYFALMGILLVWGFEPLRKQILY